MASGPHLERIATQRANVVETAFLDGEIKIGGLSLARGCGARLRCDHYLIEPRRHRIAKLHVVDELSMVLRRHLGADENRQMADFGIDGVEDPLAAFP